MTFCFRCIQIVCKVRIISWTRLRQFWTAIPAQRDAESALTHWHQVVTGSAWTNPADVKNTFGKNVDFVEVASRNTVCVFNIHGNRYRLIAAVHYLQTHAEKGRVYVLRILTHVDYDKQRWKETL